MLTTILSRGPTRSLGVLDGGWETEDTWAQELRAYLTEDMGWEYLCEKTLISIKKKMIFFSDLKNEAFFRTKAIFLEYFFLKWIKLQMNYASFPKIFSGWCVWHSKLMLALGALIYCLYGQKCWWFCLLPGIHHFLTTARDKPSGPGVPLSHTYWWGDTLLLTCPEGWRGGRNSAKKSAHRCWQAERSKKKTWENKMLIGMYRVSISREIRLDWALPKMCPQKGTLFQFVVFSVVPEVVLGTVFINVLFCLGFMF